MVDTEIVTLLNETLSSIKAVADEQPGWQSITAIYETAITKAKNNKYCSVQDATSIFLEFNKDNSSDRFKLLNTVATKTENYFIALLHSYLERHINEHRLEAKIKDFSKYPDIYEDVINYILAGEQFCKTTPVKINGFTVEQLTKETRLTPLGAFNYLVYLREQPDEALKHLKTGLPTKDVLHFENQTKH